jgi:ferredoxin
MAYVIAEPCVSECLNECTQVCPVDCIHGPIDKSGSGSEVSSLSPEELKGKQLYIDPDICIDCDLCVPTCPVAAIFSETDLPTEWKDYQQKNADFFK